MSKKSKTRTVYDPSSTIYVNGDKKVSSSSTQDGVKVSYNMDPYEKLTYDYANKSFYENLPNVNVFSDETVKNLNKEVQAFLNRGVQTIESTYRPMILETQNDVARRFGNTDNSIFMDNLKDIEAMRANAISNLADSVEEKRSELTDSELKRRYQYLSLLNGIQNQINSNMLSMLDMANNSLKVNNDHLNGTNLSVGSSSSNNGNYADYLKVLAQVISSIM